MSSFASRPVCVDLQQNREPLRLCIGVQACASFGFVFRSLRMLVAERMIHERVGGERVKLW